MLHKESWGQNYQDSVDKPAFELDGVDPLGRDCVDDCEASDCVVSSVVVGSRRVARTKSAS